MKKSKRTIEVNKNVDREKVYILNEAVTLLKQTANTKFDETIEIVMNLGVDPRHADQNIRGIASLPHGTGKTKKVLVLTQGANEKVAEDAGADFVGLDDLIEKIKGGWFGFDVVICTPDVMGKVGKMGKVLGPRGLMPSPKSGTVTMDVANAVNEIKAGRIEFRVDKNGVLHAGIGKASFTAENISENISSIVADVVKLRPASSKGQYIKKITISSSMGPGIKVDHQALLLSNK